MVPVKRKDEKNRIYKNTKKERIKGGYDMVTCVF
jgi:hypothetical protein